MIKTILITSAITFSTLITNPVLAQITCTVANGTSYKYGEVYGYERAIEASVSRDFTATTFFATSSERIVTTRVSISRDTTIMLLAFQVHYGCESTFLAFVPDENKIIYISAENVRF